MLVRILRRSTLPILLIAMAALGGCGTGPSGPYVSGGFGGNWQSGTSVQGQQGLRN